MPLLGVLVARLDIRMRIVAFIILTPFYVLLPQGRSRPTPSPPPPA